MPSLYPLGAAVALLACAASSAAAETKRPIVGYRMAGDTKTRDSIAELLSRTKRGELVGPSDVARIEQGFMSSELFARVTVTFEDAPGGVIVVATVKDKHSWIIAPTVFALPNRKSFGFGFAENNFRGLNEKLLLYGQYGDRDSLFYGVWLLPQIAGTPLTLRLDSYLTRKYSPEYLNPVDDPQNDELAREVVNDYLGGGVLVGWRQSWWLTTDMRLRWGYIRFPDEHRPQHDGWDVTAQARITIDARQSLFGVSWGPYFQLTGETTIPGLDDYDYSTLWARAFYGWRFFQEHQFELRTSMQLGRELPFHEEFTLGAASDLRGYAVERFRGDSRVFVRGEYSVPLFKYKFFAFRAVGFYDSGWIGWRNQRDDRDYLPTQQEGTGLWRNDVGVGLRVYVRAIVLPLLGFDIAYGIEGRAPEFYFELGITDF